MRRRIKFITAAGMMLAAFGAGLGVVWAATNNTVVEGTTNHSIYKAGQSITITGTVNGDIFCAGQTITVDATVNGDVLCAGQAVTVNGTVNGNVRIAGQTVTLGAKVTKAVSLAGQDVTVQDNAKVGTDLTLASQTATVDSQVGRDITGAARTLSLKGTVGRNVDATLNKLELQNPAIINGNLTYTASAPDAVHREAGARILGHQNFHKASAKMHGHRPWWGIWFAWHTYWGLAMIVMSLVLVALFPQLFNRWNKVGRSHFWLALLIGFAAMVVVPVAIVALFISLLGAPLALLVIILWMVAALLSGPLAAYYVGSQIMRRETRIPLIMLAGAVLLAIVCLIPVLGWIVTVLAYWYGIGTLLLNLKQSFAKPAYGNK